MNIEQTVHSDNVIPATKACKRVDGFPFLNMLSRGNDSPIQILCLELSRLFFKVNR